MSEPYERQPCLRLELRQRARQELEERLEHRVEQQARQEITLRQYLEKERIIERFLEWADEHNSWREVNKGGFRFSYAGLPYRVAEPVARIAGAGFSHCFYSPFEALIHGEKIALAKGDWAKFLVTDMMPVPRLAEPVPMHELGEELSCGDHYLASQLEFAWAVRRRTVSDYFKFVNESYPSKLADLVQKNLHPMPQELKEFLKQQKAKKAEQLQLAQDLIDNYPLPKRVMVKVDQYGGVSDVVCGIIEAEIGQAVNDIQSSLSITASPEAAAGIANRYLSGVLQIIEPEYARVVSRARANEKLKMFEHYVNQQIIPEDRGKVKVETHFPFAYEKAKRGESVVSVPGDEDNILGALEGIHAYA